MATWYTHCVDTLHLCMWIYGRQYKAGLRSVAEGVRGNGTLLLELVTLWGRRGRTSAAVWLDILQFERKRDVLSIERSFISESQFWSNNTGDVPVIAFKQSCSSKHTRSSPVNPHRINCSVFLDTVLRRAVWWKLIINYGSHRPTSGKKAVRFSKIFLYFCQSAWW